MKLTALFLTILFLSACCHRNPSGNGHCNNDSTGNGGGSQPDTGYGTRPISIDTANAMISSYLSSVSYPKIDTNLQSLIVNADTLRSYLKDTSIKNLKLIFAHTIQYMSKAGYDANSGYSAGGLTLVIVGYNNRNDYVYNKQGMVYDGCMPCPLQCPSSGTASNCIISIPKRSNH